MRAHAQKFTERKRERESEQARERERERKRKGKRKGEAGGGGGARTVHRASRSCSASRDVALKLESFCEFLNSAGSKASW